MGYGIIEYKNEINNKFRVHILHSSLFLLGIILSYSLINTKISFERERNNMVNGIYTDLPYRFEVVSEFFFIPLLSCVILIFIFAYYNKKATGAISITKSDPFFDKYQLSGREIEIGILVLEDKSNKEISSILCISYGTVKNHIYNIFQKCSVQNRKEFIALYRDRI